MLHADFVILRALRLQVGVAAVAETIRRVGRAETLVATLANLGEAPGHCTVTLGLDALQRYREKFPAYLDADHFQLL